MKPQARQARVRAVDNGGYFNSDFNGNFDNFDTDNNGELNQDEFDESMVDTGIYDEWDIDNNNVIDEDEFNEATEQARTYSGCSKRNCL